MKYIYIYIYLEYNINNEYNWTPSILGTKIKSKSIALPDAVMCSSFVCFVSTKLSRIFDNIISKLTLYVYFDTFDVDLVPSLFLYIILLLYLMLLFRFVCSFPTTVRVIFLYHIWCINKPSYIYIYRYISETIIPTNKCLVNKIFIII